MTRLRSNLQPSIVGARIATLILLLSLPLGARTATAQQITVGPNVQVSKDRPHTAHAELWGGADLTNPDRLIACSMAVHLPGSQGRNLYYVSHDRGKTWKMTLEVADGPGINADPACEFGAGGVAYAISLIGGGRPNRPTVPAQVTDPHRQMQVYRSADGGLTWDPDPARFGLMDREAFAADNTGGKYHGRVYVVGQHDLATLDGKKSRAVHLYRLLDSGRTFIGPTSRHAPRIGSTALIAGHSVVLSDGTLVVPVSGGAPTLRLVAVRSRDGGETFEPEATIASLNTIQNPSMAADSSVAFKDRLYAVWKDTRDERPRILFSYSTDEGKTWSSARAIDDTRPRADGSAGPDVDLPVVKVNKNGVVGVSWYDKREHADNLGWDHRFAASLDGGETFTPSVRVSSKPNVFTGKELFPMTGPYHGEEAGTRDGLKFGFGLLFYYNAGDTNGMAVGADGTFHPFWVDNRTGVSHIWTAPVQVHGAVARNGSPALANLVDVSDKVAITMARIAFDRRTGELTSFIRLKNTSEEPIRRPLKLRLVALETDFTTSIGVHGAENGLTGVGGVWDLTSLLDDGVLMPGELSQEWKLTLTLVDARAFDAKGEHRRTMAEPTFRVLAGAVGKGTP